MPKYCEMCGKEVSKLTRVRVASAILNVCDSCQKFGTPVDIPHQLAMQSPHINQEIVVKLPERKVIVPPAKPKPKKSEDIERLQIDPDFAALVRNARARLSLTQDELAAKVLERKNVIASIERGDLLPEIKTARKLEKVLGIKLLTEE
ncbi:multiprotein bridging factor aMBF1 [Thermoplasmatales archaeon AK]|nr:multiprotein bridging factor aMBF1 [Thermoplasmatales archaeon AK]